MIKFMLTHLITPQEFPSVGMPLVGFALVVVRGASVPAVNLLLLGLYTLHYIHRCCICHGNVTMRSNHRMPPLTCVTMSAARSFSRCILKASRRRWA